MIDDVTLHAGDFKSGSIFIEEFFHFKTTVHIVGLKWNFVRFHWGIKCNRSYENVLKR